MSLTNVYDQERQVSLAVALLAQYSDLVGVLVVVHSATARRRRARLESARRAKDPVLAAYLDRCRSLKFDHFTRDRPDLCIENPAPAIVSKCRGSAK